MIFRGVDSALSCAYVNSTYKEQFTTEAQRTQRLFNKIESRHPRRKGEHWIFIQALDPSLCTLCLCGANAGFRFIRSRSRTPMRRSDRAASLLSRKSQFTLQVLEADVFAARDLLLSATDRLDLIRQWLFRRGQG